MSILARMPQMLQELFKTQAEAVAEETCLVRRSRKVSGSGLAQTLVFGWMANPDASLSELCSTAAVVGMKITPQGLDQRFNERTAEFLRRLLEVAAMQAFAAEKPKFPILDRFSGVVVMDSSVITLPDCLRSEWEGCQGSALKLAVRWDLRSGQILDLALRPGREHDRSSPQQTKPLPEGALRLADLGYYTLKVLRALGDQDAYFLSRVPSHTVVQEASGPRRKLADLLEEQVGDRVDLEISLGYQDPLHCRMVALRASDEIVKERLDRLKIAARRRQREPSREALILASWTVLVTNIPPSMLIHEEAMELYRPRWQIELLFKLWKSECGIVGSRSTKPWRVLCELYAKLIGVLLNHWILLLSIWDQPDRSLTKATRVLRKHVMAIAHVINLGPRALRQVMLQIQNTLANTPRIQNRKNNPSTYQRLLTAANSP